jgi:cob(I)alamin adenosyltransferase
MKIYTKTGDDGTTGILGSARLNKFDTRIEAYGNVDELNSHVGMLRDVWQPLGEAMDFQLWVQDRLFVLGSWLAVEPGLEGKMNMPKIETADVQKLEQSIDKMEQDLAPIQHFTLPGGSVAISQAHIIRCVCRRAERSLWYLHQQTPVQSELMVFLNRLSDFYFTLSRWIAHQQGVQEQFWRP